MKAYEVIDSPEKWTQGRYARDDKGYVVSIVSSNAVSWCIMGAVLKAYETDIEHDAAREKLAMSIDGFADVVSWNDAPERTWEEVYNKLKELDI